MVDGKIVSEDGSTFTLSEDLNGYINEASEYEAGNRQSYARHKAEEQAGMGDEVVGVIGVFNKYVGAFSYAIGLLRPIEQVAKSGVSLKKTRTERTPYGTRTRPSND